MRYLIALVLLATPAWAQTPPPGMATYQMAILRRGTPAPPGAPETQKAHLAHLTQLADDGVLVGAGPIGGDFDVRGLLILKTADTARARELVAADPAVKAGRLDPEILPWWGPDNIGDAYFATMKANPSAQPPMILYQLAFLRAGPNRTQPAAEAEKIQAAHLAHIDSMRKTGKLVAAGPFLTDGALRGIFLFAATREEAAALAASDPAVKAGRLVLDFYPWMVAEGVFTTK